MKGGCSKPDHKKRQYFELYLFKNQLKKTF